MARLDRVEPPECLERLEKSGFAVKRSARAAMSLCGLSIAGSCRFTRFLNVFENDSARILVLNAGDQCITVRVLRQPEVSRLNGDHNEHRQDIEDLFKQ
jgi:hypothetical protein